MSTFIDEEESFISGENHRIIRGFSDMSITGFIANLKKISDDFFETFKDKKSIDAEGNTDTPHSIGYSLPIYKSYMTRMIEKYLEASERLDHLGEIGRNLEDASLSSRFFANLVYAREEIETIEADVSSFWNEIMNTSFDSTPSFKLAFIGQIIQTTILVITGFTIQMILVLYIYKHRVINKRLIKTVLILFTVLLVLGLVILLEISRGIFSSMYGCSIMYKMITDPFDSRKIIGEYFTTEHPMLQVFDHCYFKESSDKDVNFYDLFSENSGQTLNTFLGFFDSLKMFGEEYQAINVHNDKRFTMNMIEALETYKNGVNYDFDNIKPTLESLNNHFACSKTLYVLDPNKCKNLPPSKETCISIKTGHYQSHPCVTDFAQSKLQFSRLQEYMHAEAKLLDDMLYYLNDSDNKSSILLIINKVLTEFAEIDVQIKQIETDLKTHFDTLRDGPLETWLDCGVVASQLKQSFSNICDVKLEEVGNFAMINLVVFLFGFFSVLINFVLIFCEEGEDDIGKEDVEDAKVGYHQMKGVEDEVNRTRSDAEVTDEEEVIGEMKEERKKERKEMKANKIKIVDF